MKLIAKDCLLIGEKKRFAIQYISETNGKKKSTTGTFSEYLYGLIQIILWKQRNHSDNIFGEVKWI